MRFRERATIALCAGRRLRPRLTGSEERCIDRVQKTPNIKPGRVGHDYRADAIFRVHAHHAVEPSTPALLVEEAGAVEISDVPPEGHRNRNPPRGLLLGKKELLRRVVEEHRPPTKLVLKERAETAHGSDKPAECRPIEVVAQAGLFEWGLMVTLLGDDVRAARRQAHQFRLHHLSRIGPQGRTTVRKEDRRQKTEDRMDSAFLTAGVLILPILNSVF